MKKLLLFGGFGFIGKNLYQNLKKEYNIVIIDKDLDEKFLKRHENVKYYIYNFGESFNLRDILLIEKPNFIINLISKVLTNRDINLIKPMIELNLSVLLEIFEHSKNLDSLEVFIQFGSCEEYGNAHSPFKENIREQPNSPYGLVKQLTTNTCMMLYQNYRFPSIVIRPSNVFGAFQNKKKFIPYVIKSLIKNDTLELTPCEQKRDFIHVADLIAYIHKILKNYGSFLGEIVNICTNKDYSLKSIVEYIRKITHSKSKIIYGAKEYRESEIMSLKCDNRKIIEKTSRIEIDLWKRIKELIELYRKEQIY